jgi:hypothetical protein
MNCKNKIFFNKTAFLSLFSFRQWGTFVMSTEANDLIQALMKRAKAHRLLNIVQSLTIALVLVFSSQSALAQGWEATFGGDKEDYGTAILQTIDEGYVAVGYSESFGSDNDFDIYLVRTDVDGTPLWERIYDEGYIERAYDIILLDDGDLLILGDINEANGNVAGTPSEVYLLRVDPLGNFVSSIRFENDGFFQSGREIIRTSDGGYAIIGASANPVLDQSDILVIKLDANAEEEWRRIYGTPYSDVGQGIVEVNGGYAFAANVKNGGNFPDNDVAIYRIDAAGNQIAARFYGDGQENNEDVNDLIKTQDGNLLLVGSSNNFNNTYIIKSDLNGDTLWTRKLEVSLFGEELYGVTELEDGSIVATGYSELNESTPEILLLKMSPTGDLVWQRNLSEEFSDWRFGVDVVETVDKGFIIAGYNSLSQGFINDLSIIRVDGEGNYFTNLLQGKVFWSQDGCNPFQDGDTPLKDWLVAVEGDNGRFIGTTDEQGHYRIPVDIGEYTVRLLPKNDAWNICSPASFPVSFTASYDSLVYNFPVRSIPDACPVLSVETGVGPLQACTQVDYLVEYCNDGSATATDAYVEIFLDDELTYVTASVDTSLETSNSIIVRLGDLAPLTCGSFTITVDVACGDVQELQSVIVSANIYPNGYCGPIDPNWDMSSIQVTGRCEDNNIIFTAKNVGTGPTSERLGFVIVEDQVLFLEGQDDTGVDILNPGEEMEVPIGGIQPNQMGSTYRFIVEQTQGHPGNNYPTVVVEGCTLDGEEEYTTGQVTQFPENDQDPYVDINVQEILSTLGTANILIGHPKGYQDSIITSNTDIEYTVLFANTESDTLNRLVIRDTLPEALDLATLAVGPASHPYTFEIYNSGVLKITFDDLNLIPADSSGSETDSRGYVKFTLSQKPNLPIGTVIENRAAVYFDYIAPDITNSIRYSLACEDFLVEGCLAVELTEPPVKKGLNIRVQPNPFHSSAIITIDDCECNQLEIVIRDAAGRQLRREKFNGSSFTLQRNNLPAGLYFLEIYTDKQILQTGKLLVQ